MLYEEARVYLDHVSKYGSVLGLDSIKSLMSELGNPQNDLKFIHIAGTNGKGSILAMLSEILKEAGYQVGAYISPTVMAYEERFQINREWIAKDELAFLVSEVKDAAERVTAKYQITPTVFEIETAIAFLFFKRKECDYVVLETGLGGQTDATNIVITTELCIFASISMDHMGFLGDTINEIAMTKAGIIKAGSAVVSNRQKQEVVEILKRRADSYGSPILFAQPDKAVIEVEALDGQEFSYKSFRHIRLALLGRNQIENAITVIDAIELLNKRGALIPDEAVIRGMANVSWAGRFQVIHRRPYFIVDGAHNEDAARRLAENINIYLSDRSVHAIMGVFKDKNYTRMLEILAPYLDSVVAIELPSNERTLSSTELSEAARKCGIKSRTAESLAEAITFASEGLGGEDVIVAFGSLSYLGEVISCYSQS